MLHKKLKVFCISICIIIGSLFLAVPSKAQTYAQFEGANDIEHKALLAIQLHYEYVRSDIDSIRILAFGIESINEQNNRFARVVSRRLIGSYLWRKGNCNDALGHLKHAANYFESIEDFVQASEIYNEIGHSLQLCNELDESVIAYKKSIALGENSMDVTAAFNGFLGLGRSYVMLGDTIQGLSQVRQYEKKSIALNKLEAVADANAYLGMIAEKQRDSLAANRFFDMAFNYGFQTKSQIHKSHALTNRAIRSFNSGNFSSARSDFYEALALREELHNPKTIIEAYYNLGEFYLEVDSIQQSKHYYLLAMDFSAINGYLSEELDAVKSLLNPIFDLDEKFQLEKRKLALESEIHEREGINQLLIEVLFNGKDSEPNRFTRDSSKIVWPVIFVAIGIISLIIAKNYKRD